MGPAGEQQQQRAEQPQPPRPSFKARSRAWVDTRVLSCLAPKKRRLVWHYLELTYYQLAAMLPITMLQVLVLAIFFRKTTPTPLLEAAGLISAVIGLVLFLDGLRVAVMPLAMLVGTQLPQRLRLHWVLLVAFALGVLVTYAEPAIAAIRPLADLVDPSTAPYLYYMMNQQQEIMVLSIGMGVGVAAVVGTLKFLYSMSLKWLIAAALLPTVGCACYMQWGNEHLRPLLGLAWDCGAVTTGPVTVPVLLSLGVGVMKAQTQKRLMLQALKDTAVDKAEGNSLEGFGIVTLASLLPILAVELLAICTSLTHPYHYVLEQAQAAATARANAGPPSLVETSPVKEVVYGVRAISPLIVALVLLVAVVLRQPLPSKGFVVDDEEGEEAEGAEQRRAASVSEGGAGAAGGPAEAADKDVERGQDAARDAGVPPGHGKAAPAPAAAAAAAPPPYVADASLHGPCHGAGAARSKSRVSAWSASGGRAPSVVAAVVLAAGKDDAGFYGVRVHDDGDAASEGASSAASHGSRLAAGASRLRACTSKYSSLIAAVLMCQVGMIFFNLGLTYGFAALGDVTGTTLPSAFLAVDYDPASPYYSFAGGVALTMATIFLLGILATKAEPALNVLGETVETLSARKFTKNQLIWAVCFGVAIGMCAGACKILFQLPLIWFILAKYFVACSLTAFSRESITAVAWDSAGVTTGPVTVPFVLAIGIGFGTAVKAPEGFGVLTVMSVAPIISVLLTSLAKRPVQAAAAVASDGIARMSKNIAKVSRSLQAGSRGGNAHPVDFAAQLRDNPQLMSEANITQAQLDRAARGMAPPPMGRIGEHSLVVRAPAAQGGAGASPPAS